MSAELSEKHIFQEINASGRSLKNWVTRYGGASRCLVITVTETELQTDFKLPRFASFALFSNSLGRLQEQAIAKQSDLTHCILKSNITSVAVKSELWQKIYQVEYQDAAGIVNRLELMPKNHAVFEDALNVPISRG